MGPHACNQNNKNMQGKTEPALQIYQRGTSSSSNGRRRCPGRGSDPSDRTNPRVDIGSGGRVPRAFEAWCPSGEKRDRRTRSSTVSQSEIFALITQTSMRETRWIGGAAVDPMAAVNVKLASMTHVSRPRAFTQSAARFVVCSLGLTGLSACDSPVRRFADPLLGDAGVLASSTTSDAGDGQAGDAQTAAPAASALTSDSDSGSPGSSLGADSVDTRTEGAASNPERTTEAEVSSGSEMGDGGTAETNPVETGTGEAEARCGDGALQDGEECDDGALEPGDGCDAACQLEPGFSCDGAGTDSCRPNCGNGVLDDGEACDDGNARDGDGCSASCDLEAGFTCNGGLDCTANCGDGRVVGAEAQAGGCDDGNTQDGDGCDSACRTEAGWSCAGEPSACEATCGDGALQGSEACDDSNGESGDGCDACQIETGWTCTGSPSVCSTRCGDGKIGGSEACDDGNTQDGDGCDSACRLESGWICEGEPTTCRTECGDGMKRGSEACDDGNRLNGDGCNSSCRTESGWSCTGSAPTVLRGRQRVCVQKRVWPGGMDLLEHVRFAPLRVRRGPRSLRHLLRLPPAEPHQSVGQRQLRRRQLGRLGAGR